MLRRALLAQIVKDEDRRKRERALKPPVKNNTVLHGH